MSEPIQTALWVVIFLCAAPFVLIFGLIIISLIVKGILWLVKLPAMIFHSYLSKRSERYWSKDFK